MAETHTVGTFDIELDMIEEAPEVIMQVMGCCIVLRAEQLYVEKVIRYVAFSEKFEEVGLGATVPSYDIEFSEETGVTFIKKA